MTLLTLSALPLALLVTMGIILHWPIKAKPLSGIELRRKRAIWQNIIEKRR